MGQAIANQHISGNGPFTQQVHRIFEAEMGFAKVLMTHSCTAALEMAAMLCDFQPGDEVILPSYTHVGTANAFLRAGATLVFADSLPDHPNVDPSSVQQLIGPRTKALVLVHYAGVACDLHTFSTIAQAHGLLLIEDAAHAIGASYAGKPLGSFGHLAAISFHETKNITCGQGGLLILNDDRYIARAQRIWENGTNRAAFFRGETDHYTWVDQGSSFTTSDLIAAYLSGQLAHRATIFTQRLQLWQQYQKQLAPLAQAKHFQLPNLSSQSAHNGHIFYLQFPNQTQRASLLKHLRKQQIHAVFHYIPLHSSPYFAPQYTGAPLPNCDAHSQGILRLPLYHSLSPAEQAHICQQITQHYT